MNNCDPIIEVPLGKTVYVIMPTGEIGHIHGPVIIEIHNTGEAFVTSKASLVLYSNPSA